MYPNLSTAFLSSSSVGDFTALFVGIRLPLARDMFESKYDLTTIEESIFSLTSRDREHLLLWIMRRNCAQA